MTAAANTSRQEYVTHEVSTARNAEASRSFEKLSAEVW